MSNTENEIRILCKNCNWDIPDELINNLINGISVFCEKCGFRLERNYYNINLLNRKIHPTTQKTNKELIKSASKKLAKSVRKKYRDLKKRIQENKPDQE